jgi:hypothetical protein
MARAAGRQGLGLDGFRRRTVPIRLEKLCKMNPRINAYSQALWHDALTNTTEGKQQ